MKATDLPAARVLKWLQSNLGPRCTAPLTGTDLRALQASVQIAELYALDNDPSIAAAYGQVVSRMQSHTQHLAYHSIAMVRDWSDRKTMWHEAGLPQISAHGKCSGES